MVVGIVVALAVGAPVAWVTLDGSSSPHEPTAVAKRAQAAATGSQHRRSSQASPLFLGGDASCSDFQQIEMHGVPTRVFVDGDGSLGGGSAALRARLLPPKGSFIQVIEASVGNEVEVSAQLHNSGYDGLEGVAVAASISGYHEDCWRIIEAARDETPGMLGDARFGPILIRLKGAKRAALEYVKGSTTLLDREGHLVVTLPDGVVTRGIPIPFSIPGGYTDYLNFRVRIIR
jgi:hypothetical protein